MTNCPSGKSSIGPRSTLFGCCLTKAGATMKPERGHGDEAADHRAEAERRALEEAWCAGSARSRRPSAASRSASSAGGAAAARAGRVSGSRSTGVEHAARRVADPQAAGDDGDRGADGDDRASRRSGPTRSTPRRSRSRSARGSDPGRACSRAVPTLRIQHGRRRGQRRNRRRANSYAFARRVQREPSAIPYSSQRRSTRLRTSSLISISGGHSRVPSAAPFVRRVDAELAAVELERRRVVEVVERPLGQQHVPLRVDVRADARRRPPRSRGRPPYSSTTTTDFVSDRSPSPQIACITFCA